MAAAAIDPIVRALSRPQAYPHPAQHVERLETHISWVFLAGDYAYKVKKPVTLPFVDFASLAARRHYCEEELRLNRRFAPALYLDVVEIRGEGKAAQIGGSGPVLDYAVRMQRFPQETLASALLARGTLGPAELLAFGCTLGRIHRELPAAPDSSPFGQPETVLADAAANFDEMAALLRPHEDDRELAGLRRWTEGEFRRIAPLLRERRTRGKVRECHGDLHLRNLVRLDGALVPFDGIEFNAGLRWIDVLSDAAFLVMDLLDRGAAPLAWSFLNAYLEQSGDYEGVPVLRFYLVYRALVRAKVHLIRAAQHRIEAAERDRLRSQFRAYVALARRCACERRAGFVAMHGFSGCGKSMLAAALASELPGIRIRSDVERKRLQGLCADASSGSALGAGLYGRDATEATYAELARAAEAVATGGYTAIVDATFLRRKPRSLFAERARALGVPLVLIDVQAAVDVMRARVAERCGDASEATLEVLAQQMATAEPIQPHEGLAVVTCESNCEPHALAAGIAASVRTRMGAGG